MSDPSATPLLDEQPDSSDVTTAKFDREELVRGWRAYEPRFLFTWPNHRIAVGTLPVYLYTRIQTLAPTPEFYAIGTVVTSVAIALVIAAGLLLSRNQRRLF